MYKVVWFLCAFYFMDHSAWLCHIYKVFFKELPEAYAEPYAPTSKNFVIVIHRHLMSCLYPDYSL